MACAVHIFFEVIERIKTSTESFTFPGQLILSGEEACTAFEKIDEQESDVQNFLHELFYEDIAYDFWKDRNIQEIQNIFERKYPLCI